MTVETTPEAKPGLISATLAFLGALKGHLTPAAAVCSGVIYFVVAVLGALGWGYVAPAKEVKVLDAEAVLAAVAETKQAESVRANERIAYIAENRDLDGLAEKCGLAVRDAIQAGKRKK